ncbi:MAG TPA: DNA repair protein RecN [Streptosporangiaceae bacterium]|jgi:DNA repair protein RecN (Recombination protein N)|nr:DNA repair protein RecN [Streptosporangiaceae bacterium]
MLEEVRISGLGVIDDAVLELSPGFNVVTGETGAGKTMVVSGLGLLFGGKADPSRVRPGFDRASVEGRLRIKPDGEVANQVNNSGGDLDDDGATLVLLRSVSAEGRSRAYAGGRSVPVSLLTYLADDLVAVHGQADQQQLLKPGRQRAALDRFAGPEFARLLSDYQRVYQRHLKVRAELDELVTRARERAREAEDLRHGLEEIERLEPLDGEDLDLQAEAERLTNADTLHNAATTAHEALISDPSAAAYDSADVLSLLGSARSALEAAAPHDPALGTLASRVSEVTYLISDVAADLASYADSIEADPGRLAVVQDRRAELTRLIRQYGAAPVPQASGVAEGERAAATGPNSSVQVAIGGVQAQGRGVQAEGGSAQARAGRVHAEGGSVQADEAGNLPPAEEGDGARPEEARSAVPDLAAVLSWAKGAAVRLAELDGDDEKIAELETLEAELAVTVRDLGGQLSSLRQEAATTFDDAVTAELGALAMPHARLKAVVSPLREYGLHGGDDVEIKLAAHPGAPALALHKGASGGELSRVMLAIEVVFAGANPVPTFVFDEVDAGVGGKAAVEIGRRLARLARRAQVIVVTHLPQVAAFADTHLVVEKANDGSVVSSGVARLDDSGRVRELSRMLAGLEDSEFGRAHATELLAAAAAERTGEAR